MPTVGVSSKNLHPSPPPPPPASQARDHTARGLDVIDAVRALERSDPAGAALLAGEAYDLLLRAVPYLLDLTTKAEAET